MTERERLDPRRDADRDTTDAIGRHAAGGTADDPGARAEGGSTGNISREVGGTTGVEAGGGDFASAGDYNTSGAGRDEQRTAGGGTIQAGSLGTTLGSGDLGTLHNRGTSDTVLPSGGRHGGAFSAGVAGPEGRPVTGRALDDGRGGVTGGLGAGTGDSAAGVGRDIGSGGQGGRTTAGGSAADTDPEGSRR